MYVALLLEKFLPKRGAEVSPQQLAKKFDPSQHTVNKSVTEAYERLESQNCIFQEYERPVQEEKDQFECRPLTPKQWYSMRLIGDFERLTQEESMSFVPEQVKRVKILIIPGVLDTEVNTIDELQQSTVDESLVNYFLSRVDVSQSIALSPTEKLQWKNKLISVCQYMSLLVETLETSYGYERQVDLFVKGYDASRLDDEEYVREWCESASRQYSDSVILISHSLGCVLASKLECIKWCALSPVWSGSPLAIRCKVKALNPLNVVNRLDTYGAHKNELHQLEYICGANVEWYKCAMPVLKQFVERNKQEWVRGGSKDLVLDFAKHAVQKSTRNLMVLHGNFVSTEIGYQLTEDNRIARVIVQANGDGFVPHVSHYAYSATSCKTFTDVNHFAIVENEAVMVELFGWIFD